MSQHNSLKSNKWIEKRSVRTRRERIEKLKRNLKWVEGMSVYGLPKEIIRRLKLKIKKEEVKKEIVPLYSPPTEENKKRKISRDDIETKK